MDSILPGNGKIRVEKVSDLLATEFPKENCYIEPGILVKGSTLILGGLAKIGKSFMSMELMRSLSTGKSLFDNPDFIVPHRVKTLYVDMEVGRRTNQKRLEKILEKEDSKIWGESLYITSREWALDFQLDSHSGLQNAASLLKEIKPNVLILDPISFMFHGDEDSNTEVGKLFYNIAKLKELGQAEDLSVIFSHHFRKPPTPGSPAANGYDALDEYNFRGAGKWKDGGDTLITMKRSRRLREAPEAWELMFRFLSRHDSSYPEGWAEFNWDQDLRIKWKKTGGKSSDTKLPPLKLEYKGIDFTGIVKEPPKTEQLKFKIGWEDK